MSKKNRRRFLKGHQGKMIENIRRMAISRFPLQHTKSDHGIKHWEQVRKNIEILAWATPGSDLLVGVLFAYIHDSQRKNELEDPAHGTAAAYWVDYLCDNQHLIISDFQRNKLKQACRLHHCGQVTDDPIIGICWDADRLDLPRVGIQIDKNFLSTDYAKKLVAD